MLIFRLSALVLLIAIVAGLIGFGVLDASRPLNGRLLFVVGLAAAGSLGLLGFFVRRTGS